MALNERLVRSDHSMPRGASAGLSLVELLIVVAIVGVIASLAISQFEPGLHDQLRGAAQVVAADVTYARSLAVSNNSSYRFQFDLTQNCYWLQHSGSNASLNNLPSSPFRDPSDPSTKQTTFLSKLPGANGTVQLVAVRKVSTSSEQDVQSIEFDSLGALTQPETAVIWLAVGNSTSRRYVSVQIDPTTGLTDIGDLQPDAPRTIDNGPSGGSMSTGG